MNEVARVKDEGNKQKMTVSILDEEASKQKLPLDNLKETVMAQYGDDARLILDSIDEVEAILLRRQARAKGEFDDTKAIIHLSGLSKKYESAGMTPVDALKEVDLSIVQGEMVAVIGPSGSGKSTLLQMMGALDVPTSGGVRINFHELSKMNAKELTQFRSQTVGFVFQKFNLIPNLSALENVSIAMESTKMNRQDRRSRAAELLKEVGLDKRMSHLPGQLSGGEQQRVSIARALANHPKIIYADEPTGSLDSKTSKTIIQLFDKIRKDFDTTIIIVTHNPSIAKHCDRTVKIKDGRIK
jgi:ABC-type lipoprotein export system ATPase subunit|tara:strand:+ start:1488 stop:2384 length:897 start_codon:yes stop_codon:yes gene_type:complete